MTYEFVDIKGNAVKLSFQSLFEKKPGHVWVICRYDERWLLTKHPTRGLEFPGGKVEAGEEAVDAARREVYEETGAIIGTITYVGQYIVYDRQETIVKNIYYASIVKLERKSHYEETNGPCLLKELPENIKAEPSFSFLMKDQVLQLTLAELQKKMLC